MMGKNPSFPNNTGFGATPQPGTVPGGDVNLANLQLDPNQNQMQPDTSSNPFQTGSDAGTQPFDWMSAMQGLTA
jgi:hypothetical protein